MKEEIDVLVRKMTLAGCRPTLHGHGYARSVRQLYLESRLKLVNVTDLRSYKREDDETDLATPASICTYDELAAVHLNEDLTVTLYIKESMVSLNSHPSRPRVNFTLSGEWWAISKQGEGFPQAIDRAFSRRAASLFELEEAEKAKRRCLAIEAELLAGTYDYPESALTRTTTIVVKK
jgi:hypothetical protein